MRRLRHRQAHLYWLLLPLLSWWSMAAVQAPLLLALLLR
jgi:hypothetical protein